MRGILQGLHRFVNASVRHQPNLRAGAHVSDRVHDRGPVDLNG